MGGSSKICLDVKRVARKGGMRKKAEKKRMCRIRSELKITTRRYSFSVLERQDPRARSALPPIAPVAPIKRIDTSGEVGKN